MTRRERMRLRRAADHLFDIVVDLRKRRDDDPDINDNVLGTLQGALSQVQSTYPVT
jgi:hypothetical protein